jgi:hypothetical protein
MKKKLVLMFFAVALLFSCSSNSTKIFSEVTGKEGEIVVSWSSKLWKTPMKDAINDVFVREIIALPQTGFENSEKSFRLMDVDPVGFGNVFKKHRNVVQINFVKNYEKAVVYNQNMWAKPQSVIIINATDTADLRQTLTKNKENLYKFFWNVELKRMQDLHKKSLSSVNLKILKDKFNVKLNLTKIYQRNKTLEDFEWYQYINPGKSQQHLIFFSYDYTAKNTFTKEYILSKLDTAFKHNVKADLGAYMCVDRDRDTHFKEFKTQQSSYVAEVKGLWELKKGFMGGPFICHSVLDEANNKVVCACAFVFAPQSKKRNLVRELEAILLSMEVLPKDRK